MELYEGKYGELLRKHLSGDIPEKEQAELFRWLEEDPARQALLKDLERIWERSEEYETPVFNVHTAWAKMQERITAPPEQASGKWYRKPLMAAASAVLLVLAAALFYFLLRPGYSEVLVRTRQGETKEVFLPDGSAVSLNGNSLLSYDRRMNQKRERRVRLEGEALFEVAENAEKPFIVGVNETETRVLGTSFNILSGPGRESVKVSLLSGKVEFSVPGSRKDPVVLTPGYEVIYNEKDESLIRQRYGNGNFL
ncbi:MAG TPA: FecR domain-containing protein, partial [Anseongella sp.]|nr:FecR domain-containing protein [Anseongella sp.]